MKTIRTILFATALSLALPLTAQDFGYPKEKAFYKAHWNEVLNDLGEEANIDRAQYVLFDFNGDNSAELYLWLGPKDEYLYTIRENKAIRVSQTESEADDDFDLGPFYPYFMAPYEMLVDKPIDQQITTEQQIYDRFDIPSIWFKLHRKVEGTFNIKNAIKALNCFDCEFISDAMYALYTGEFSDEWVDQHVVDITNGYAMLDFKTHYKNMVEFCYWNLPNGEKLLAMNYHIGGYEDDETDWFAQTLFMKYNPKTHYLEPVVAPIQGMDFKIEYSFLLPHKGKNITLSGADDAVLKWTGNGFKYQL